MTQVSKIEPEDHRLPADPMVSMIERVVMSPDADLDKLERMLAMKERMDAQNAKIAFARALSAARTSIPPIIKDATVDFTHNGKRTHYQHETLAGIAKVIDSILAEHGLSYRFRTEQGNSGVRVTCIIQHSDGHSEETSLAGAPDGSGSKNSFQAVGSAVTYLQRYTLKAALGLSAEVDDDGQGASPRQPERQQDRGDSAPTPLESGEPYSPYAKMRDDMIASIRKHGVERVAGDPKFQKDLAGLRAASPELAANVDAAIESKRAESASARHGDIIDAEEIPY